MKALMKIAAGSMLALSTILLFTQCKKDDTQPKGQVQMEVTDAPIDDAQVKGAFVTIAEVQVDGKVWNGFSGKQTIDLLAYQNGNVKSLGLGELEAGTYSNITFVLDLASDANGNQPGCYVLTTDNVKHDLNTTGQSKATVTFDAEDFEVKGDETTTIVVDFDLRKSIAHQDTTTSQSKYGFVTSSELSAALRGVVKAHAGTVKGKCNNSSQYADKVVVYAYKKGTYNKSAEVAGQGASKVQFANAVTSATVDANGNFTLSYLPEGDYELVFAGYKDEDGDGSYELKGFLDLSILGGLNLGAITVNANASVTIEVIAMGLLPL